MNGIPGLYLKALAQGTSLEIRHVRSCILTVYVSHVSLRCGNTCSVLLLRMFITRFKLLLVWSDFSTAQECDYA